MKHGLAILFLFLLTAFAQAEAIKRETVFWYISDFPPAYILTGPSQGQGMGDRRIQILAKRMPEFRHEIVVAPQSRFMEMVKAKSNVCNAGLLKTPERETFMEFSAVPYGEALPNGIITTRKRLDLFMPFLNNQGELRLDDFLASGKSRLGIIASRSFGAGIDAVLKKYAQRASIVPSSDHLSSRLMKLSNQNEFDAVIAYPTELLYLTRELGLDEKEFVFLPVAEEPQLTGAFIACSKSEFGKEVMAAINRLLADPVVQREIAAAYRAWLPKDAGEHFERLRQQLRVMRP